MNNGTFYGSRVWFLSLCIGRPIALLGFFHLLFPQSAWAVYRGWGKLWNADPQEIAPACKSGFAMRVIGIAYAFGGVVICAIPKVFGF